MSPNLSLLQKLKMCNSPNKDLKNELPLARKLFADCVGNSNQNEKKCIMLPFSPNIHETEKENEEIQYEISDSEYFCKVTLKKA